MENTIFVIINFQDFGTAKEYLDILIKRVNTLKQSLKDILFDALGVGYAVLFLVYLY